MFCVAIFTGAFLLFQVQPLIGKYILPWFGGGPGVWTTCLLFFQCLLFAGYAYAHLLNQKLPPARQAVVHLALLVLALVFSSITPGENLKPGPGEAPVGKILLLLTVSVGIPYLVLASTGPLIQAWFSRAHPGRSPYRLYSLSNVGSLLALLSFPFLVEPNLPRDTQMGSWSNILRAFLLLYAFIAWRMRGLVAEAPNPDEDADAAEEKPVTGGRRVLWLVLPAIGTVMLMSTTNLICQEIAVIPFLWVVPLALYLITFIIAFDNPRWYWRPLFGGGFIVAAAACCHALNEGVNLAIHWQLASYIAALFFGCMICHGELFRLRPPSRQLTAYYLSISGGGALGGLFVSLAAPALFTHFFWEFHLGLFLCAATGAGLWIVDFWSSSFRWRLAFQPKRGNDAPEAGKWSGDLDLRLGLGLPLLAALAYLGWELNEHRESMMKGDRFANRNFYGLLKVYSGKSRYDDNASNWTRVNYLMHGRIMHGKQFIDPDKAQRRISYFAEGSGIGVAMMHVRDAGPKKVGVLGLGVGAVAAYANAGDTFWFYEINPAVAEVAENTFTYLAGARDRNATVPPIILGDGRLMLEAEPDTLKFDVLSMDAFSSDSVPVHLLTTEAFAIYEKHLEPDGVIVINITNRYLDLEPVVRRIAEVRGLVHRVIKYWPGEDLPWVSPTTYVLLSPRADFFAKPAVQSAALTYHSQFADQLERWYQASGLDIPLVEIQPVGQVLEALIENESDETRKAEFKHALEVGDYYEVDAKPFTSYKYAELLERRKPRLNVKLWTDDYSSMFPILK